MRGLTGRDSAKNSCHSFPFSCFKSGRATSSESERATGPSAVQFEVMPPPLKGWSVCSLPGRDYAPGNSPGPRGSGPDWPSQIRSTGFTRQSGRQLHGDVCTDRGPPRGGAGEKPAGERLATDKRHCVDTEREVSGLVLYTGGKQRVAELRPVSKPVDRKTEKSPKVGH